MDCHHWRPGQMKSRTDVFVCSHYCRPRVHKVLFYPVITMGNGRPQGHRNPILSKDLIRYILMDVINHFLSETQQQPGRYEFWIMKMVHAGILAQCLPVDVPDGASHT